MASERYSPVIGGAGSSRSTAMLFVGIAVVLMVGCGQNDSGSNGRGSLSDTEDPDDANEDTVVVGDVRIDGGGADGGNDTQSGGDADAGRDAVGDVDSFGDSTDTSVLADWGQIIVTQRPDGGGHRISGGFTEGRLYPRRKCTADVRGKCRLIECGADRPEYDSAGVITIAAPLRTLEVSPSRTDDYRSRGNATLWESSGETVDIRVAGDVIPQFDTDATTVTGATLKKPALPPAGEPLEIDTSADLEVRFASEKPSSAQYMMGMVSTDAERLTQLSCYWEPTSSTKMVPKEFLQRMVRTDVSFGFTVGVRKEIQVGAFGIVVNVGEIADDGDETTGFAQGDAVLR